MENFIYVLMYELQLSIIVLHFYIKIYVKKELTSNLFIFMLLKFIFLLN